ncbi:lactosylceramide alpha-2,3-sialyltransferase-like [Acipenser ruthenus]|uniref:lactosylceramide alpha-2,3-sialyltransferase-like n=1 Tax=Acipenser ruthenus TaxID=7906 RepID=UPI00145A074F|nr:lactosylceramide alpha-2,3-sialyltransferase-like [Acipenser ruthenus]
MRSSVFLSRGACRFTALISVVLLFLAYISITVSKTKQKPSVWDGYNVDPNRVKRVQTFVTEVLQRKCKRSSTRKNMSALFPGRYKQDIPPFLRKNHVMGKEVFKYPPPFGFQSMDRKLKEVLDLFPKAPREERSVKSCSRCVVVGSGGIMRGLEMGQLLDQFDVVIRLNNAPVRNFIKDVGNKTTIRMSYPEGSPKFWDDVNPKTLFVTVIYKTVDINWLKAMIKREKVSLWDRLFFWQEVPKEIPIGTSQFRILNPEIIGQTAVDLLQFSEPRRTFWGWDQNVPTLGVTAIVLATYLCDEVSLAGFGYDLKQPEAPLHYYEDRRMDAMKEQTMHNVDTEKQFLEKLVKAGAITDLTGGVHCSFCEN